MMEKLDIPMPESGMAVNVEEALSIAKEIGYPVMVRPSYVLGGRGMEVVYDDASMEEYMKAAVGVTPDRPILIDRFLNHATECEADAISDGTHAFVPAVMEHIELAGVHSGDSACIIPSVHISPENVETIKEYTRKIAEEMHVRGLMNMQYAIENGKVYVLEANPRRPVPFPWFQGLQYPHGAGCHGYHHFGAYRTSFAGAGFEGAAYSLLRCERSGIPLQYVPGGGSHPGTGNAFHRRSSGTFPFLRRSLL